MHLARKPAYKSFLLFFLPNLPHGDGVRAAQKSLSKSISRMPMEFLSNDLPQNPTVCDREVCENPIYSNPDFFHIALVDSFNLHCLAFSPLAQWKLRNYGPPYQNGSSTCRKVESYKQKKMKLFSCKAMGICLLGDIIR